MLANVDALLEKARAYSGRGFRAFARDVDEEWSLCLPRDEGVVDADEHAIKIVTIHSSKGLEWPVVIPINTASGLRSPDQFIYRRGDDTLHWVLDDVVPPELAEAMRRRAADPRSVCGSLRRVHEGDGFAPVTRFLVVQRPILGL